MAVSFGDPGPFSLQESFSRGIAMRKLGLVGAAAAAVGYVLGRRQEEVRAQVERLLGREDEPGVVVQPARSHRSSYDTEYDHLHETELADRHRVAEEIKSNPLRERGRIEQPEADLAVQQAVAREREDVVGPRPF